MIARERGPWLVVPGEMMIPGGQPGSPKGTAHVVPTLMCLQLDAETAKAAGWVMPS